MHRIGIRDVFGESGTPEGLYAAYGLDADGIARSIRSFLRP